MSAQVGQEAKTTPGPWRWEVNMHGKEISLRGGVPRYDLTVMDFVRYGMNSAAPRFLDAGSNCRSMILRRAEEFSTVVPGREHHEDWFRALSHPDAHLIAASPTMYDVLAEVDAYLSDNPQNYVGSGSILHQKIRDAIKAALGKA